MVSNTQLYKNFVGTVVEVVNRFKAVVEVSEEGTRQRALLKVEKLACKPKLNPDASDDHAINDFVQIGTVINCVCHRFEAGEHKCTWFVADVLSVGQELTDPRLLTGLCPIMMNRTGWVSYLDKRQGIISFKDGDSVQHDLLFLASKFYEGGKRINTKQPLDKFIAVNDKVYFDAVPIDPEENDNKCAWFATVAWKGKKPPVDYDTPTEDPDPSLAQIKTIIKNPKSQFIRGKGQIMQILNDSYGIALGAVNKKQTHWQSILFHRSCASLFKFSLADTDLRQVFKEGDKIRFIAASAPKGLSAQWIASHISIDVVGDARNLVTNLV
ncbi:hypothetical protein ONE63_010863 [Megalurothrips usitatus]|uniref:Uncharacterized protein n=1 Tax=Megalurothrips usitatus TaxID=439358 RepID=A0AAV7XHA3_9NEOP|nr:hypothetical protein ONE63_010863 [Megalurothrips usitatus]